MKEMNTKKQQDLDGLSVRRRQELAEAEQSQKRKTIYWVVGIVVAVLVCALLVWDSGMIQRSAAAYQVGSYGFSVNDVNYYYYNQYNQVAPYASYYGLDTSLPLDEQEYADGQTWAEYLMEQAKTSMQEVAVLCTDAKANGFTITEEGQKSVDDAVASMKEAAANYGLTEAAYLNYAYGRFMTPSAYKKALTEQQLAADYAQHMEDSYDISADDLQTYYQENADTFDTFDYDAYYISLGLTAEYDDDGNQKDYDADALKAAQDEAKAKDEELKSVMESGTDEEIAAKATELGASDMSDLSSSSLSYYPFGEWISDEERTAGEVGVVEGTSTNSSEEEYVDSYYVVRFNSRTLEEYYGVNFYNLLIQAETIESAEETEDAEENTAATEYDWDAAEEKIQALQEQWIADGATAEGFLAMAEENTDGSTTEYTNVDKGAQNTEVDEWLFGSEHKAGDYAIIRDETLHGYRLVYFTGYDELYYWQTTAKEAISHSRYDTWLEQAKEGLDISETALFAQAG